MNYCAIFELGKTTIYYTGSGPVSAGSISPWPRGSSPSATRPIPPAVSWRCGKALLTVRSSAAPPCRTTVGNGRKSSFPSKTDRWIRKLSISWPQRPRWQSSISGSTSKHPLLNRNTELGKEMPEDVGAEQQGEYQAVDRTPEVGGMTDVVHIPLRHIPAVQ